MLNIIRFILADLLKNKTILVFMICLALFSWTTFSLEDNMTKGLLSLLNIVLLIVPLATLLFSTIYIYNSKEFTTLLLSQPIHRSQLWLSQYVGLGLSLCLAYFLGVGIPILIFAPNALGFSLIVIGLLLTLIFISLAFLTCVYTKDKTKGIGVSIVLWLYFAIIYDAVILLLSFQFAEYPIEQYLVVLSLLSPLDIARIFTLLQSDNAVLFGYTGAIFNNIFGGAKSIYITMFFMILWFIIPLYWSLHKFNKQDL